MTSLVSKAQITTLYDNTGHNLNTRYHSTAEFGDQIVLGQPTGVATDFAFEYYGLNFTGGEQIRIRFYNNDGPEVLSGAPGDSALAPGATAFYDSGLQNIAAAPDGAVGAITLPGVVVPNTFTWSVEFAGVTGTKEAGLDIYSPPIVGDNFDDYWERGAGGAWELRAASDGTPVSFGAKLTTVPEPGTFALLGLGGLVACAFSSLRGSKRS